MTPPFSIGSRLTVEIDDLSYGGDGVAHPESIAVFIPRTVPGDKVEIEIRDIRRRYARAVMTRLDHASPHRQPPTCHYFDRCGGCHYQHVQASFIAETRLQQLNQTMIRLGPGEVPIRPLKQPLSSFGYRNRMTYHRAATGEQGYVAWDTHETLDIDACPIAHPSLDRLWNELRVRLADVPGRVLPYVVLRRTSSGEQAVIAGHTEPMDFRHFEGLPDTSVFSSRILPGARSPFAKVIEPVSGKLSVRETFLGIDYDLRPDLFFQVNAETTELLLNDLRNEIQASSKSPVMDLFCGAGLITLQIASLGIPALGVEVSYPAVQSAQVSAALNRLETLARFRTGKAERMLGRIRTEGERFPVAIVDPPRGGLHPAILPELSALEIEQLFYVSCSPATMARDLKQLVALGYRCEWLQPYEMFPQTYHFEVLGKLSRA